MTPDWPRILWLLGLFLAAGVPARETEPFAECERVMADAPVGYAPAKCFYDVARARNLWPEARRRLIRQQELHPELPWLAFYRASLAKDRGEAAAEDLFGAAAAAFAEGGDGVGETYARINRARILAAAGRIDSALAEVARAEAAAGTDVALGREVRMLELRFRYEIGDERVALKRDLRALEETLTADASYSLRRDIKLLLAASAYDLGEFRAALRQFEAVATAARLVSDAPTVARAEISVLRVALAHRAYDGWRAEARARAEHALEVAAETGEPVVEAAARLTLGRLLDGAAGIDMLEQGLAIARRVADAEHERDALGYLALRQLDDPWRALALIDAAHEAALRTGDPLGPAAAWHEQLAVRWRVVGRDAAIEQAAEIFAAIERVSRIESTDSGGARRFSEWAEAYHWFAGRLFMESAESGDRALLARAFAVLERLRARLLAPPGAPADERPILASLTDTEAELGENEALISIQVAQDRNAWGLFAGGSWLTVSTRRGTELYRLPPLADLEPRIAMLLALVERRDGAEEAAAQRVFEQLLGEAVASLPATVERLILIPDGPLHRVPFAALRDAAGHLLGQRYLLTAVPSATVWRRLRRLAAPPSDASVVAVIDPLAGPHPASFSGLRGWWPTETDPGRLAPLPFARREGRAIRRRFGRGAQLLEGADASEESVRAAVRESRLLHFATHALVDDRSPERSAVVLAQGEHDDGLLTSAEIAGLALAGPLVVLSTCESAAGPLLRGEGAMSLARSFFRGGARTVVASLWRLRDREAAALFDRFYRHLTGGVSVAAALRAAQKDRLEAGTPASAWAGVAVLGDGAWVPIPTAAVPASSIRRWSLIAAAALILLLSAVIFGRHRS